MIVSVCLFEESSLYLILVSARGLLPMDPARFNVKNKYVVLLKKESKLYVYLLKPAGIFDYRATLPGF